MERKSIREAFSLVELLISLIIISCVVAAFAPIMTKKLSKSAFVGASNTKKHEILLTPQEAGKDEYYYSCENDLVEDSNGKRHLNCTLKNLPASINVILLGAGGGGASALDGGTKAYTKEYTSPTATLANRTLKLNSNMRNIKISLLGAGGGGGGVRIFILQV